MAVHSTGGLIEALARGDFAEVFGTSEGVWVDFKRDPYPLDTPRGQWELAKDVAAFAESPGGLLVIGFATEKVLNEGVEVASAHHPIPKNLVVPERYKDIIAARVYPPVADIQTHWYPPGGEAEGVFVIEIPPQDESGKPFLVTRMLDEEGVERGHSVGFPRRDGDRVTWMRPEAIHHHVNVGRRIRTAEVLTGNGSQPSRDDLAVEVDAAVRAADAQDDAWLTYQAIVTSLVGVTGDPIVLERIRPILLDPPSLRPAGFNFRSAPAPEWIDTHALELSGRASLRISDRGVVTACLPATEDCLGWALSQHLSAGDPLLINPLTLAEYTLEYFRLVDEHVSRAFDAQQVRCRVLTRAMKSDRVVLQPGPLHEGIPLTPPSTSHIAHDEWESAFECTQDPERDAFEALIRVYASFGLSESAIPYSENHRIASAKITAS